MIDATLVDISMENCTTHYVQECVAVYGHTRECVRAKFCVRVCAVLLLMNTLLFVYPNLRWFTLMWC
jgi:hypothetical protein